MVLLSNVASGLNPGQAGLPSSTAHVAPPPNRHVRFSDEAGGEVAGSYGQAEFFGAPMDTGDHSTGGTAYEGDSGDDPTVIGVFPATDEAARRGFGWGGNLIDCADRSYSRARDLLRWGRGRDAIPRLHSRRCLWGGLARLLSMRGMMRSMIKRLRIMTPLRAWRSLMRLLCPCPWSRSTTLGESYCKLATSI